MSVSSPPSTRKLYLDAAKCLGILLVLFGHFEEFFRTTYPFINATYEAIYLFHMALFCMCSGAVARFSPRKLIFQQLWLYLIAQGLCYPFRAGFMGEEFSYPILLEILLPWRHFWYLFALIIWSFTVPMLTALRDKLKAPGIVLGLLLAFGIGLGSGFVEIPFPLIRVFSFYPLFAVGVLCRDLIDRWVCAGQRQPLLRWLPALPVLVFYLRHIILVTTSSEVVLEGVRIWQDGGYSDSYTTADRMAFYCIGIITSLVLFSLVQNNRFLADLGQRTLPVYVIHMPVLAFIVQLGVYESISSTHPSLPILLVWILLQTGGCFCLFITKPVCSAFDKFMNVWRPLVHF